MLMKRLVITAASVLALSASAAAQRPLRGAQAVEGVTPAEIQRMFDAYALLQAQEQLKIADDQYTQFLTRFKALQDVRRKALQERVRIVQELRRILNGPQPDESQIKDRLKMLDEVEVHAAADS